MSLKSFLEYSINRGEEVEDFTCESCMEKVTVMKKIQIMTEESSRFFIAVFARVAFNYHNNVTATEDITLIDSKGAPRVYSPLSIIHHRGGIRDENASGRHYMCDTKNKEDGSWYYTSDASEPKKLEESNVTKKAFIVLYMRRSRILLVN